MSDNILAPLSPFQKSIARRTMSAWAFYYIVGDALITRSPLSTVRMGDGERMLLDACRAVQSFGGGGQPIDLFDEAKRKNMGIDGITHNELYRRLQRAGNECSYFCPSVSGLTQDVYALHQFFAYRDTYVDNFFVNVWDSNAQAELYRAAGKVLLIHRNAATADALQINCKRHLNVDVSFIQMDDWRQSERVIERACATDARLVLFAAGPASKYIASEIVNNSNKVALDLGNSTDQWTLANFGTR